MRRIRLPRLAYNWITAVGIIIASVVILLMTFLYIIDLFASETNPYVGIFLYMALPPFMVLGFILIPIGMFRKWLKMRKGLAETHTNWPTIDLNYKSHRNAALLFVMVLGVLLVIGAFISYEAYHFTESVTFCGKTCHTVMKPEYVAYQNSPHARVACVECHVGAGADWYAKSKLSGLYQVYAVMSDKFPRPIPTPIENLRPARETCEKCHWPGKFYGAQQRLFDHYMYDETNSYWPINMLVKTGGGDPKSGPMSGIHWHTFISHKIEYIARDKGAQDIPWVRSTDLKTGRVSIYQNTEEPLTPEELDSAEVRVLDCMDCHNRPSHIYNSPDRAIDAMLQIDRIDKTLPEIKRVAVEAMAAEYETEDSALHGIANHIIDFYMNEYPDVYGSKRAKIDQAVLETQLQFSQNIFPEMKVRWENYPDNIGHFYTSGCMRCHEGNHSSEDGETLTTDCYSCHIILAQGSGDRAEMATTPEGLPFIHPEDIDEAWKEMGCYECHTGTQP
jgi:hypothetical protein